MQESDSAKILVIEDDPVLGKSIVEGLSSTGYQCRLAENSTSSVKMAQDGQFHVVILDLALEDESGLGVLRCVREANENASIVILTPLNYTQERLTGLEAGADDFIIKPFTMNEMRARVQASLLRLRTKPRSILEAGPLRLDLVARKLFRGGRLISLTPTEFRILEMLLRNHGKVVTRRMLCKFLWNPEWEGVTNVIEVHINRLRSKITKPDEQRLIHTVRGSGYTIRWDGVPEPNDYPEAVNEEDQATI